MRTPPLLLLIFPLLLAAGSPAALDEAVILYQHDRFEDALQRLCLPAAREQDPLRTDLLLGLTLQRLGRPGEAVAPFRRALALSPSDLDAALNLGVACQATGQWSEAEKAFNIAAQGHPERAEPWLGLGALSAGRGRWPEAVERLQKASALDPRSEAAWIALSDALVQSDHLQAAVDAREKALALQKSPDPALLFKQAAGWYGLGNFEKAAASLATAHLGDRPEVYLLNGSIQYRRGDLNEAERQFNAALQAKPDYPEARLNLGITLYGQHRYQEAVAQFKRIGWLQAGHALAQEYSRESAQAAVDEALHQGAEAVLAGDIVTAVRHWDQAEALAPGNVEVHKMLVELRSQQTPRAEALALEGDRSLASKDLAKAVQQWSDALSIDPRNARAKAGLIAAASDLKELKAAYLSTGQRFIAEGDLASADLWARQLTSLDAAAGLQLKKAVDEAVARKVAGLDASATAALKAGKPEDALPFYAQALKLTPADPRLQARKQSAQIALDAKVGQLLSQALVQEGEGHWQGAYDLQAQALALEPEDLEAREGTARLARHLNLKRMDPHAVDDLYYRGVYLYGSGETQKALDLWKQALVAAPKHGPLLAAVHSAETKLKSLAALRAR